MQRFISLIVFFSLVNSIAINAMKLSCAARHSNLNERSEVCPQTFQGKDSGSPSDLEDFVVVIQGDRENMHKQATPSPASQSPEMVQHMAAQSPQDLNTHTETPKLQPLTPNNSNNASTIPSSTKAASSPHALSPTICTSIAASAASAITPRSPNRRTPSPLDLVFDQSSTTKSMESKKNGSPIPLTPMPALAPMHLPHVGQHGATTEPKLRDLSTINQPKSQNQVALNIHSGNLAQAHSQKTQGEAETKKTYSCIEYLKKLCINLCQCCDSRNDKQKKDTVSSQV